MVAAPRWRVVCWLALAAIAVGPAQGIRGAGDPVKPRTVPLSAAGLYVPVALDAPANDRQGTAFPGKQITVSGVPFDLVARDDVDNLFLKSAGWPDWKEDPSNYYAEYDRAPATSSAKRPIFRIPVADYQAVCLLAAAENDPGLSPRVSLRIGAVDGPRRTTLHDFAAVVPRWGEKGGRGASLAATGPQGNLFLVRVPLGKAFAQDFRDEWAFDVEVTKELRLAVRRPDPCRFQFRPLGLPCGVHLFGMTFQRAAVQMEVAGQAVGNVFVQPETPAFAVQLVNLGHKIEGYLEATVRDDQGQSETFRTPEFTLPPLQPVRQELRLEVKRHGYHEVSIAVRTGRNELNRRETTLAWLPADTRKHRDECPLGTWDFGGTHYSPSDPDQVGPLYFRAGLRYGMFSFPEEKRRQYGVLRGNDPAVKNGPAVAELLRRQEQQKLPRPERALIFHEDAISGPHVMRTPDVFTGRAPYRLDEKERERFDQMWAGANDAATELRRQLPGVEIYFGNGNPHLLEEFLRRGFPKALFDARGNEAGSFMRMPETQPLDFVANNAGIWMDRQILDHYGYRDKRVRQCYEITYPCTNPGNLSLRTQAAYFVRHAIHSLAWGVPVIRPGVICDMGNSYYYSNWGASGLCFAKPDVRPKPAYVAIATLTQMLDGARFRRAIPAGSPSAYAAEFERREGGYVTVLWTLRGSLSLQVRAVDAQATVVDLMGNAGPLAAAGGKAEIVLSPQPVFLRTLRPLTEAVAGKAALEPRPKSRRFLVSDLGRLDRWETKPVRDSELEWYNFECPRRLGEFAFKIVPEWEGERGVLECRPPVKTAGSPYLPLYAALRHPDGVAIPGEPTEIGLMVHGNGGWGRLIFELTDASGQRWISLGAAQGGAPTRWMADWMTPAELERVKSMAVADWNTNDAWQRSRINFEGWHYLRFPLPGNYPGEGYHWPSGSQWRHTGDGVVHYPLRFTRLIVEMPEKVLHLTEYTAVKQRAIYLKDLSVTYDPVEEVAGREF